jgi:hypothetical protein
VEEQELPGRVGMHQLKGTPMHGTTHELRRAGSLARVRSDIGAVLRGEARLPEEPTPPSLLGLLRRLEARVRRDTDFEKRLADVEACITALLRAAGREPAVDAQ